MKPPPDISRPAGASPVTGLLDGVEEVVHIELDAGRGGDPDRVMSWRAFQKLLVTLACFAGLVGLSYALDLTWAQPWRADEDYLPFWNLLGREVLGQGAELDRQVESLAQLDELADELAKGQAVPVPDRVAITGPPAADLRFSPHAPHPFDPRPEELAVELERPEALADFYAALTLTDLGYVASLTRVGHWGDSVIGNDGITSAIRRRMQARFGDGGHGWHAIERYDASYRHQGVVFESRGRVRWTVCGVRRRCMEDQRYGYGGVVAWTSRRAESRLATTTKGPIGRSASRFELWYAEQPRGGVLELVVDGQVQRIDTSGGGAVAALTDAWLSLDLDDDAHEFAVRAAGPGPVRAYGMVLERGGPGLVWDGMALIGSFTNRLADQDPEHFAAQLGRRDLDLIVLSFGGNDMTRERSDLARSMAPYIEDYGSVLELFASAAPGTACLIIGPVDHGQPADGRVVSRGISERMTEAQREVARIHGCAFFDTLAAMGGPGSVAGWRTRSLMSPDLSHPSPRGHRVLGAMIFAAIMRGYHDYRAARVGELIPGTPGRSGQG